MENMMALLRRSQTALLWMVIISLKVLNGRRRPTARSVKANQMMYRLNL